MPNKCLGCVGIDHYCYKEINCPVCENGSQFKENKKQTCDICCKESDKLSSILSGIGEPKIEKFVCRDCLDEINKANAKRLRKLNKGDL